MDATSLLPLSFPTRSCHIYHRVSNEETLPRSAPTLKINGLIRFPFTRLRVNALTRRRINGAPCIRSPVFCDLSRLSFQIVRRLFRGCDRERQIL